MHYSVMAQKHYFHYFYDGLQSMVTSHDIQLSNRAKLILMSKAQQVTQ